MIRRARLIPRLTTSLWAMAEDHAEHEGWCITVEWLGLQVQIAIAGLTRSFDWPNGAASGHPNSGTAEVAPSDVSANRPAEPLRSGLSNPAEEGA